MKAFISYSRADWRYVESIARELRTAGLQTWVDTENIRPGDSWEQAIGHAIRTSHAFIACISPFSIESIRTSRELETAIEAGLAVFPVMIDPTPIESLPESLRQRHIVSLFRDPPAIGPRRVARQIAEALGLPDTEGSAAAPGDAIAVLIVRLGDPDHALASSRFVSPSLGERLIVAERTIPMLDRPTLARVTDWLRHSAHVYLVIGHGARDDDTALLCGLACSIVGPRRLNLVPNAGGSELARRMADLIECRLVEPIGEAQQER